MGRQLRGRRPQKTGGVFAGIRRGFFGTENNVNAWPSFATVEWSMWDRLLRRGCRIDEKECLAIFHRLGAFS